jgi:hypothetical protein
MPDISADFNIEALSKYVDGTLKEANNLKSNKFNTDSYYRFYKNVDLKNTFLANNLNCDLKKYLTIQQRQSIKQNLDKILRIIKEGEDRRPLWTENMLSILSVTTWQALTKNRY